VRKVKREELLDYATYAEGRDAYRQKVLALKAPRRIHVGENLTFLFENADTVRYQVQEMMLTERIVKEAEIQHELATYNELLGGDGELGCTLLIEITDPKERDEKLSRWQLLPKGLYALTADGEKVRPSFDERQISERRLSSVHYLKFALKGRVPVALGCDFDELKAETKLGEDQKQALAEDLKS
jgi:hypothetical protein